MQLKFLVYQQLRADAAEKLIPEFEAAMAAKGTEVDIELVRENLDDTQFVTKATQQFNAGTAPDIIDVNNPYVNGFAGAGYLLPLDDYLADWSEWDDYYPVVKEAVTAVDGQTYALPHEASVQSFFYRADVLKELGIDTSQPETWDDMVARLKEITAKTGGPSLTLPAGKAWGGGTWAESVRNVIMGDGPIYDEKTKTWTVASDGWTQTFELYDQLVDEGLLPVKDLLNPNPWEPTKYVAFPEGTIPVAAQGTWGWKYDWGPEGSAPIENVTEKVATWQYPAFSAGGDPYSTLAVGNTYVVNADTKYPDVAVEFAKWMSSGEAMAQQLVAVGAGAPRTGIEDISPYAENEQLRAAEAEIENATPVPTADGVEKLSQAAQIATEGILTGKLDGAQAAAEFAKQATDLLGKDKVATK
ncbi:ABC transporter substrate-binding protein [Microterricola gilva]|uniref:ABC transporter substrate-binding protein n=1 Tax=Microterricola gilva TaxID=393267 RepID=UPI001A915996|nr:extracellular solute-binding protein [Microterricola gilva]